MLNYVEYINESISADDFEVGDYVSTHIYKTFYKNYFIV